jgi:hypothetical protein
MFQLFREIQKGEFFVVFGDCAQGGEDNNCVQFLSKSQIDIPLKLKMQGVAASMTPFLIQALEWIYDRTGVAPIVALERNNGGASEMHNLMVQNKQKKYRIYSMKKVGTEDGQIETEILGYETNAATRPKLLGEYLTAYNGKLLTIYSEETLNEHQTFIVSKNGKPEADANTHDDEVISCAGAWQLYQTENPVDLNQNIEVVLPKGF